MAAVIINPGTGPVAQACETDAQANMLKFREDVAAKIACDAGEIGVAQPKRKRAGFGEGRFSFTLARGTRRVTVEMPGIKTARVRWMNLPEQNIWDFPRLYVDGSSWVWFFAINAASRKLDPTTKDDEP